MSDASTTVEQGFGPRLRADQITVGYTEQTVVSELSMEIPDGSFTVIVGPNACGKSTLLRALSRLLAPKTGSVVLDGQAITSYSAKDVARRIGLLPQSASTPGGMSVAELVSRGRYPHQGFLRQWTSVDEQAIREAMTATGTLELSSRRVDELSGGQRQRAWIAMTLAQQTPVILLDEPTTFLDIAHQIDLMELLTELNRNGRTIVAVLHDLNQAARYASHLIAMKDGAIRATGTPSEVITASLIEDVFDLPSVIGKDPVAGTPVVFPIGARSSRSVPEAAS